MALPLRTSSYSVVAFITITLVLLIFLGFRQSQSQKHYESIIKQNEKIVFQFAGIREKITESLVGGRYQELAGIISDVETLNANISNILKDKSIPEEYRLSFAGQIDPAAIVQQLKDISANGSDQAKIRELGQEVRVLGERLMLFDRIIVNHVKRKLIGFQSIVIGYLAVIVFIVINILLYWHRHVTMPLVDLVKQVKEVGSGKRTNVSVGNKGGEITELANSYQDLLAEYNDVIRESATYRHVVNSCQDLILILSGEGSIIIANQALLNISGLDLKSIVGRDFLQILKTSQEAGIDPSLEKAIRDGESLFSAEISLFDGEYLTKISRFSAYKSSVELLLVVARDISMIKASKTETIMASRLAAMGELAVGVAHEINNLSNGLINYTQILTEDIGNAQGDKSQIELLNNVIQHGERIASIVQPLLFSNIKQSHQVESVQISKVISNTLSLIKHQLKYDGIQVSTDFAKDLPPVRVNMQKIQHVLLNIFSNARYALNSRYPEHHADKCLDIRVETIYYHEGKWLRINLTDHGTGIDPDILSKIFDPFFTTKTSAEGTGLGLSICRGLLADNNGSIKIESIPKHHTTVIIDLPAA